MPDPACDSIADLAGKGPLSQMRLQAIEEELRRRCRSAASAEEGERLLALLSVVQLLMARCVERG